MKKLIMVITIIAAALSGCKTQQQTSTVAYDDVYANPKYSKQPVAEKPQSKSMDMSAPQQITTPDSTSGMKSGSSSWYEDYTDYSKSSGQQVTTNSQGNSTDGNSNYVDPNLYDNSYSSNPDVNIYVGSSYDPFFWGSSVSIGCGFGWGWDSYYWGYPYSSWYYPYYGFYPYSYGWGGYWNGYWDGYNDGFWDGHHGNPYYNTYSSFYYGQRRMLSSSGEGNHPRGSRPIGVGTTSSINKTPASINPRDSKINERTANTRTVDPRRTDRNDATQGKVNPRDRVNPETGSRSNVNTTPADRQHYTYDRNKQTPSPVNQRTGNTRTNTRVNKQGELPAPKYSRTENRIPANRNVETQNYSSPAYRQPKTSQDYINPRTQDNRNNGTRETNVQRRSNTNTDNVGQSRSRTTPSSNDRRYATPSNNNTRSSSTPSRSGSSSGYSSPTRSYSTPSSSGTRSSSGGSYSSPSRSSGGSSSPSSGGGGGRRK
jgi:hypothetical protein